MPEGYGPDWRQRVGESLASLRSLGRRAWLALLGIAVGCAAVVALLNIGHSAAQQARQLFQDMGSDLMVVDLTPAAHLPDFAGPPAEIRSIAPLIMTVATVPQRGQRHEVLIAGSTAQLVQVLDLKAFEGRLLSGYDDFSPHVLLGATLARTLDARIGDRLVLGVYLFNVVGVLAPLGYNPMLPVQLDDAVLMPLHGMQRLSVSPEVGTLLALGRDSAVMAQAADVLRNYLSARLPGHEAEVRVPQQLIENMASQSQLFTWLLAGFATIALLLGGVGVMNVMVMNVTERRCEVGIRLAIGARGQDIAWLFLLEALLLAGAGALLGALVGLLAAWSFAIISGWRFVLDSTSLPLGIGSSLVVGVFFGLQPALAAARLQPVVALRDD
ncbi:ABC transporter permease [Pseudomonas sp. Teo4]|uniref:ABC transporter permease n=1 Tax=Pseudomonas sp. Teo4 TaxID=3064528 RepID=UPI002ABAFC37|nr:ABC transporter permease [Pseudomonas sp. Teo4]MDZ3995520.1 Macrolide export ATP-binding/permease protein MacB [Pseudomonas sp. Teo4]